MVITKWLETLQLSNKLTPRFARCPTPERNKINFISPRRFRNKYENTERLCKFFVRP